MSSTRNRIIATALATILFVVGFTVVSHRTAFADSGNIEFSVPSSIRFVKKEDGTLIGPSNASIKNNSDSAVYVSGIQVSGDNYFQFVESISDGDEDRVSLAIRVGDTNISAAEVANMDSYGIELASDDLVMDANGEVPISFSGQASDTYDDLTSDFVFGHIKWTIDSAEPTPFAVMDSNNDVTIFLSKFKYKDYNQGTYEDIEGKSYTGVLCNEPVQKDSDIIKVINHIQYHGEGIRDLKYANDLSVSIDDDFDFEISFSDKSRNLNYNWIDVSKRTKLNKIINGNGSGYTYVDVSEWDVSNVKDMSEFASSCHDWNINVSEWNTASLEDCHEMFWMCSGDTFNPDVSKWDTKNLRNASSMFFGCEGSALSPNLSEWNTQSLETTDMMFYSCKDIKSINILNWDTANLTDASNMFRDCSSLQTLFIFDVPETNDTINFYGFCYDCTSLRTVYAKSNCDLWKNETTSRNFGSMFDNCTNLRGGQGTSYSSIKSDYDNGVDYPDEYLINYLSQGNGARIDGLNGKKGFFTSAPGNSSIAPLSLSNITNTVKGTVLPSIDSALQSAAKDSPVDAVAKSDDDVTSDVSNQIDEYISLTAAADPITLYEDDVVLWGLSKTDESWRASWIKLDSAAIKELMGDMEVASFEWDGTGAPVLNHGSCSIEVPSGAVIDISGRSWEKDKLTSLDEAQSWLKFEMACIGYEGETITAGRRFTLNICGVVADDASFADNNTSDQYEVESSGQQMASDVSIVGTLR